MRRSSKQSSVVAAAPIPLSAVPPSLSTTPKPSGSSSSSSSSSSLSKRRIAGSPTTMSNGYGTNGSSNIITNSNGFGHAHRTSTSSSTSFFSSSRRRSLSDPFNRALEPPLNESPSARENRIRKEQAAKARSDDIDEQIKREKAALKRQKQAIKILLLGQSESGKSTTLKQFQLLHSPAAFHQERMAWRVVIYLNLIRSVRRILDALIPPLPTAPSLPGNGTTTAIPTTAPLSPSHAQTFSSSRYNNHNNAYNNGDFDYEYDTLDNDTLDVFAYDSTLAGYTTSYSFASTSRSAGNPSSSHTYVNGTGSSSSNSNSRASPGPSGATSGGENASVLQARFERYAKTLAPLFALELRLMRQLSFPDEEDDPVTGIPDYASEYAMSTPTPSSTPTPTPFSSLPSSSSSPPKAKSPSSPSQPWWWNSSTATSPPPLTHLTIPPSSFGGVMSGTGMGGDGNSNGNSGYGFSSSLPFAPPSHASASSSSSNSPISPHPYQTASSPTLHTKASTSFTSAASSSTAIGSGAGFPPLPPISAPLPIPLPIPVPPLSPTSAGGELTLRTSQNWKKTFSLSTTKADRRAPKSAHTGELAGWWEDPSDPVHIVHHCAYAEGGGMIALWRDRDVRRVLERKRVRMEESSGFYLNEIERIAGRMYIPQDDDILRARLKTLGVVEHTFTIKGSERSPEWKVYDVGGARSQRQAWAPYFEDVNAIIFLAPISAFDQTLAEDARVNRLEDSMLLWRSVVSNKLLTRVSIILFLNKIDLLRSKLEAGVQLSYHMPSYAQRKNDYNSVSEYFRHKFKALHTHHTPNPERDVWIHLTSVTDKQKTHIIIANVRDLILRENLQNSRLI